MRLLSSLWWVAVPAALWGCQPEIPQDDPVTGERVIAVFDPATSTIPLPNSAALEDDGTLPNLGAGTEGAAADFFAWLDDLHGWPESTSIAVPFSGPLDPSTVTSDNVILWRVEEDGSFTQVESTPVYLENDDEGSLCDPSVCESVISIVPAQTPRFGTQYAAVVTKDVHAADGEPVERLNELECVGDDLEPSMGGMESLPFPRLTNLAPDEALVFAFIVFESRQHRDEVTQLGQACSVVVSRVMGDGAHLGVRHRAA